MKLWWRHEWPSDVKVWYEDMMIDSTKLDILNINKEWIWIKKMCYDRVVNNSASLLILKYIHTLTKIIFEIIILTFLKRKKLLNFYYQLWFVK